MECFLVTCCGAAAYLLTPVFPETFPGAGEGIRTPDPLITNQMLYQLSYASEPGSSAPRREKPS